LLFLWNYLYYITFTEFSAKKQIDFQSYIFLINCRLKLLTRFVVTVDVIDEASGISRQCQYCRPSLWQNQIHDVTRKESFYCCDTVEEKSGSDI